MSDCKAYVSVSNRKIYAYPSESPWEFEITTTQEMIPVFYRLFDQLNYADIKCFWRAHVPIRLYHQDRENDMYDIKMKKVYALIHEFCDKDSQKFIEQLPYFKERKKEEVK